MSTQAEQNKDRLYGAQVLAKALASEGVKDLFLIPGAPDLMVEAGEKLGIKPYVVRHEQAAGFAADAYARCLRKPGVACTSLVPGAANITPAMYHARGANSPVVLLAGSGNNTKRMRSSQQMEPAPVDLFKDLCKWTMEIPDSTLIGFWVRKAMRDAIAPVQGPITLEIPTPLNYSFNTEQVKYVDDMEIPKTSLTAGDPVSVKKAAEMLVNAKSPVLITGDGVYWSDGCAELREFVELLQIPTSTKRTGRGALPESHPLAFGATVRKGLIDKADVICIMGNQFTSLDQWFEPPEWPKTAKYIQIQEVPEDIWYGLRSEINIVGASKLVLQQMVDYARDMLGNKQIDRQEWVSNLLKIKQGLAMKLAEVDKRYQNRTPMHTSFVCQKVSEILDSSSTLIYDSFSASSFMTSKMSASYAGQILDAGIFQSLGHSIGMMIGAQIARPSRQVCTVIGDGGFGIGGMDMETLARYKLPAVAVLINNSSWGGRAWGHEQYYPNRFNPVMTKDMRYDKAFEEFGCHGEYVTKDDELMPALERAFNSGKPAVVNVIADTDATHPMRIRANLIDVWMRDDYKTLPQDAIEEMKRLGKGTLLRTQKQHKDLTGDDIPLEDLSEMTGISLEDRK